MKRKIGKCTSAKELWEKLKNIYMVEEVIKTSEESDEKDERNSSNENDNNIEYFQSEEEVDPNKNKNYEIKEEIDFEEQLICTFDEIKELKKKNALLEEILEE
jgi:hypothetical protein